MTKKDKIIAAFLVSMGIFSSAVASKYVSTLSSAQKDGMIPAIRASKNVVLLANTNTLPIEKTVRNG